MNGRGRCYDNIFVERFRPTVNYEEVYLNDYQGAQVAGINLDSCLRFYNWERMHKSLNCLRQIKRVRRRAAAGYEVRLCGLEGLGVSRFGLLAGGIGERRVVETNRLIPRSKGLAGTISCLECLRRGLTAATPATQPWSGAKVTHSSALPYSPDRPTILYLINRRRKQFGGAFNRARRLNRSNSKLSVDHGVKCSPPVQRKQTKMHPIKVISLDHRRIHRQ